MAQLLEAGKPPSEFSERDLDELATVRLNRRQIQLIIKTAQSLALRKGWNSGMNSKAARAHECSPTAC
jgi:hypothetical protein